MAEVESAETTLATAVSTFEAGQVAAAGDTTDLVAALVDANALHDGATEGVTSGTYKLGSKATLKAVIDAAQAVVDKATPSATETEIATAESTLATAVSTFEAGQVAAAGDTTDLVAALVDANALHDGATEGVTSGTYKLGSKATLKAVIDAAQAVVDKATPSATETEIAQAEAALANAVAAFEAAEIQ